MTPAEFKKHIALCGADLSLWPQENLRAAVVLLRADAAVAQCLSEAESLDHALRHLPLCAVDTQGLEKSILALTRGMAQQRTTLAPPRTLPPAYMYGAGGGLIFAAVLGFMVGLHAPASAFPLAAESYGQDVFSGDSEEAL